MSAPLSQLGLSPEAADAIRATWRAAGGTIYSAPSGQMAAMKETAMLGLLASFQVGIPEETAPVPAPEAASLDELETALFRLISAVCPGLDSGNLLADARTATAAMASAAPIAHFQSEVGEDNVLRIQNVQEQFKGDADVFPLFRRAATVAELQAMYAGPGAPIENPAGPAAPAPRKPRAPKAAKA